MYQRIIDNINNWLNEYLLFSGDSEETLLLKKIWWVTHVGGLPFLLLMSFVIGAKEGMEIVVLNIVFVVALLLGLLLFHFHKKEIQGFAFASQLGLVVLSSIKVYLLGGLLTAGGAIFIGLMGPLYALTLPNKRRAIFVFILYMVLMIAATLVQPQIPENYLVIYYVLGFIIGITIAFVALYYYTSQVQRLEQEEKRRMNELDDFKTKFYTHITHEFRTPLTIILGMANQMKNDPDKWHQEGIEMIKRSGKNLLNLTNQMLDLSKLEVNAMPVNFIQDDIAIYLNYLVESFHSLAGSKNISLSFLAEPKQIRMDFDPDKIQDILSNLITNAIKFTPKGGQIEVFASLEKGLKGDSLVISVKDNGVGIPKENIPKVFNRYFQAENQNGQLMEGTGLGLALTKELVKLIKGSINVQSSPGEGSIFRVHLPVTNTASDMPNILSKELIHSGIHSEKSMPIENSCKDIGNENLILLIVEDNMDVVRYLQSLLSNDYKIVLAGNGKEGFEKAIEIVPDIVISDVMMPVMDGYTFCEKLKGDLRTSHIPIVLLTARTDSASRMEGLKAGADVYLAKPFNRDELLVRIEKLIQLRVKLQTRYKELDGYSEIIDQIKSVSSNKEDSFIQKMLQILKMNLSEDEFGIAELCQSLGMSRSQLYRKFSALTNTSVHRFIQKMRLNKAKELLLTTELHVNEVAYDTGFKNPSHFSRIYSQEFGIAPSKTRNQVIT